MPEISVSGHKADIKSDIRFPVVGTARPVRKSCKPSTFCSGSASFGFNGRQNRDVAQALGLPDFFMGLTSPERTPGCWVKRFYLQSTLSAWCSASTPRADR